MAVNTPCPAPCHVVGVLEDGWASLAEPARAALAAARLVIGVPRTLASLAPHLKPGCRCEDMSGALGAVPEWARAACGAGEPVVILATGDPLCHGIGGYLAARARTLPDTFPGGLTVLPNLSTLQLAYARLGRPWQGVGLLSVHQGAAGEWSPEAGPDHGLQELVCTLARAARGEFYPGGEEWAVLTSPANTPGLIARALLAAGLGAAYRMDVAACLGRPQEAVVPDLGLEEAASRHFPDPNLVVLRRRSGADVAPRGLPRFGLADTAYLQRQPDKGLITKQEARALSLAKLHICPGDLIWDIGAGSGSVGLEAARLCGHGHVWAMEKNPGDAAIARQNRARLGICNYTLVEGRAPAGLEAWPDPHGVFIGGSGGELAALITLALTRLRPGGRLVLNLVTLENLATATQVLGQLAAATPSPLAGWDVVQLQASRSQPILDMHRLAAQNPVWVVSATRAGGVPTSFPSTLTP